MTQGAEEKKKVTKPVKVIEKYDRFRDEQAGPGEKRSQGEDKPLESVHDQGKRKRKPSN